MCLVLKEGRLAGPKSIAILGFGHFDRPTGLNGKIGVLQGF
tara:strand:- start:89 stop:211 length:123 start_codon:yes stop_codon:yes gene_type:complete